MITVEPTYPDDVPTFDGKPVFGRLAAFTLTRLEPGTGTSRASVDTYLGLTPGTTQYGVSGLPGSALWGITGTFRGTSAEAVQAAQATLLSLAGIVASFGAPTGGRFPSDFEYLSNCTFYATEFVPQGALVSIGGGDFEQSYRLVIRQISGGVGP